ncbi:related to FAD binding domain protein [Cephalotrichum gorgonifer]|uniref:Related to FAD binding domain protein n=1 Tax=Cephalotrichum gorgonifer TaxID=2041049 RepID=A0AAE8MWA8_9PEZI|nr:related to FAD binding domain protein [Cephalotrichum gorgonifer]
MATPKSPVLIVGAGVSGLVLAQYLKKRGIPYRLFERDSNLTTRGIGWGLTLHWSLPDLQSLLPAALYERLPEAYVDRGAVDRGESSRFPFYDLSTGELKAATPKAPHSERIRVTRGRLRKLLATDVHIEWSKSFSSYTLTEDSVTVTFEDGTQAKGCLLVACDGGQSRVRRALFPDLERYKLPVRTMGLRVEYSPQEMKPIHAMDPFFMQAAASENDTFMYFSVLDAPKNHKRRTKTNAKGKAKKRPAPPRKYSCQLVVSWPSRPGFFGSPEPIEFPATNAGRVELLRTFAQTWAEPFRGMALGVRGATEIKTLEMYDCVPPKGLRSSGRVVLMGDAMHQMTMYRGEGANHAIVDVQDFARSVADVLLQPDASTGDLRDALDKYEDAVVDRSRPGVLAARRACLDAHEWGRIDEKSPLLTRRAMKLDIEYDC